MDIYLLICTQDRGAWLNIVTHRVIRCIPTTLANFETEYKNFINEHSAQSLNHANFYPLLISRPTDVSFLEDLDQEKKQDAG